MRFLENVTAAAVLLASNGVCIAQQMPTSAQVAQQQADFAKALSQVPMTTLPREQLGAALNKEFVAPSKIDPMEVAKRFQNAERKSRPTGSDLMVFVSFSMPREVIVELSKQAKQYGATVVMRGFHGDSMTKTEEIAQQLNPSGATWQINPDAFKTFKITSVPAIVLAAAGASSILEEGCAKPSSYVSVSGNQSIDVALQTMRRRSDNHSLSLEADVRLKKGGGTLSR